MISDYQIFASFKNMRGTPEYFYNMLSDVLAKIRYKDSGTMCTIEQEGDLIKGIFHESASAIAPGQSAVFYEGSDVLGGGIIC